jgi:cephalosporin-C deacetylase
VLTDLPLNELEVYRGESAEPADFDQFWQDTLGEAREAAFAPILEPVATSLTGIDVYDLTFSGFGGDPVRAWLRLPQGARSLPALVQYQGYGGGRGHPLENLQWAACGYAHLLMDTRGQGSVWSRGDTDDPHGGGPQAPGMVTRGIESPRSYYYRRLIADAVRAVDAVREIARSGRLPQLGAAGSGGAKVAVMGHSQGGLLALAAAGLAADLAAVVARVPFLCDPRRAVNVTDAKPFSELTEYLAIHRDSADAAFTTLSYSDGVNFARRAAAPALMTAALMDAIVPPSTVFAAYNNYAGPKEIKVWPFNGHESGGPQEDQLALDFLARRLTAKPA